MLITLSLSLTNALAEKKPNQRTPYAATPQIVIVIDDLGYELKKGRWLAERPYPITLAVIPGSPHAKRISELALDAEQELILHVPMQPKKVKNWEEGLTLNQNKNDFLDMLESMLEENPYITGINNHGGSGLTESRKHMNWVMQALAKRQLFFLDSRTTSESQAIAAAEAHQVDNLSRDVFLDNIQNQTAIAKEFERLKRVARRHGKAIAIGHPYPATLAQLQQQLPLMIEEGFELTTLSSLLNHGEHQNNPMIYVKAN